MNETAIPTPYDILDPLGPPLVVPEFFWWITLLLFLLLWIWLWFFVQNRKKFEVSISVSPIVKELQKIARQFKESRDKKYLHLFIKTVKRSSNLITPEGEEHLRGIERERFASELSSEVDLHLRELLSILSSTTPGGEE